MDPFILRIDRSKDNAIYYAIPVIGAFYRRRLAAAVSLLPSQPARRLLDAGYGSGALLQCLPGWATRYYAVDHHDYHVPVRTRLAQHGIPVLPARGDVMALPFAAETFDVVCCLSVLEHVPDLPRSLDELRRVLVPGGLLIAGFPPKSRLTSACFHLIGFDHARHHPNSHEAILSALGSRFTVDCVVTQPRVAPMYIVTRCTRKE